MKAIKKLLIICIVFFCMGCPARSFYPFFLEKNLIFNPGLVGAWTDQDKKETYFFQKAEGKNYDIIICKDKGDTSFYRAQLGQIDKKLYLDSYPNEESSDFQLVPTHILSKIFLNGDSLLYASLESEYVKGLIKSKNIKIDYTLQKEEIILTAPTEELQQLILKLAQDEKAFPNPTKLVRVK